MSQHIVTAFLSLGSNLGDRQMNLNSALKQISERAGKVSACSGIYETQSWGRQDLPDFLNLVCRVETQLQPLELLQELLQIEEDLGRERTERWGSRTLDIDLLLYGDFIVDLPQLQVPHPRMHLRRFVLQPLAEIAAEFRHPQLKKTVNELLAELQDDLQVKLLH